MQEVNGLDEYVALTRELFLYVGRMDYRVDLLIPWARFGEADEWMSR